MSFSLRRRVKQGINCDSVTSEGCVLTVWNPTRCLASLSLWPCWLCKSLFLTRNWLFWFCFSSLSLSHFALTGTWRATRGEGTSRHSQVFFLFGSNLWSSAWHENRFHSEKVDVLMWTKAGFLWRFECSVSDCNFGKVARMPVKTHAGCWNVYLEISDAGPQLGQINGPEES